MHAAIVCTLARSWKGGGMTESWVIIDKQTGKAVAEIYDPRKVALLKPDFYAVPVEPYLQSINGKGDK